MRASRVRLVGVVLLGTLLASSCALVGRGDTYEVNAEFQRAVNLYPGSPVRALGIEVGSITDVENEGETVRVTMAIKGDTKLPADAFAVIVPVTVLGERYVQVGPVYEGGPALADGSEIPLERTRVPFEIDELLRGLDDYLSEINPDRAGDLIENLAELLEGQGQELNDLIHNASGTFDLLADKGDEFGAIVESLAQLTTTLGGRTEAIQELIRSYNTVSGVLATNQDDLNAFVTNLDRAAVELGGLLETHNITLQSEIGTVTTVGQTLQRNISRLERALTATPRLFAAAALAYDAELNNLPLNNSDEPSTTEDLYKARLRDRLSGLCRRIIVALGGPAAAAAAGLVASNCSDPDSSFWDDLFASEEPGGPEGSPPATAPPSEQPEIPLPDLPTLADGLDLLAGLINPDQLTSLQGLSPLMLEAINSLTDRQVAALAFLTPGQMAALAQVEPDQLSSTLDRIIAGQLDPATLLDTPLLPPSPNSGGGGGSGSGGSNDPTGSGLGGVLGGGG